MISACALLVLYYSQNWLIPCIAVASLAFCAAFVSLICFCVRRQALSNRPKIQTGQEVKEVKKFDFLNIEDPLLHKAITHFHYRCCDDVWEQPAPCLRLTCNPRTRRVIPAYKTQYQVIPFGYTKKLQESTYK